MPERDLEQFSNPLPPQNLAHDIPQDEDETPLTNEDFRKLLTSGKKGEAPTKTITKQALEEQQEESKADARKKKKLYYAKLKKLEEEKQKELSEKYRDRAKERREGHNKDYDQTEMISTTADYRAVAPDAKALDNYAERRKQQIQESKYLGGDMEHTHLVKGLDFALLEKVRAEISNKEMEDINLDEVLNETEKEEKEEEEYQVECHTKLARNIFNTLFKKKAPERNELFLPGRMAYVVDLEDEYAESDIPTTLIRSKADCPTLEATTTLSTNDIVINKLTQILSYLRQGKRDKRKKMKEKAKLKEADKAREKGPEADDNIFDEAGDYDPASYAPTSKSKDKKDKERDRKDRGHDRDRDRHRDHRDRDRDRDRRRDRGDRDSGKNRDRDRDRHSDRKDKKRNYFEKPADEDDIRERDRKPESAKDVVKSINEKFAKGWAPADLEREAGFAKNLSQEEKDRGMGSVFKREDDTQKMKKIKKKMEIDSYAECYPGLAEAADAFDDSDDEADYTKMDMGNKKGPVGRWDFDTQEEYSKYMSNKEALPKAAFQYGVKMADGRKTRRAGPKDEKSKLDQQWRKIENIMNKRKDSSEGSSSKRPKY